MLLEKTVNRQVLGCCKSLMPDAHGPLQRLVAMRQLEKARRRPHRHTYFMTLL